MSRPNTIILVFITLICGTGAFLVSRSMADTNIDQPQNCRWLDGESSDAVSLEEKFTGTINDLSSTLRQQRQSLSQLIADEQTDADLITQQAETIIATQEDLIRSVAEHVTLIRGKISQKQRAYLMDMCASNVRGPMRRGNGRQMEHRRGNGQGHGQGNMQSNGKGNGFRKGRQFANQTMHNAHSAGDITESTGMGMCSKGRGRRIAERLALDQQQMDSITEMDPDFDQQCQKLCTELETQRAELLAAFENDQTSDDEILRKTDELIKAHTSLERRIISHIIIVRPFLSSQQQRRLVGLCGSCPVN